MKLTLDFEVGGQDIEWHVEYSPARPDTRDEPGDDAELNVERAMLLTHVVGGRPMRLDILDLITEVGEDGLPDFIYTALCDLAEQALSDAADADAEARAEAAAEALRARSEESWE
jgi:hypothetical protein